MLRYDPLRGWHEHLLIFHWIATNLRFPGVVDVGRLSADALASDVDCPSLRELAAYSERLDPWLEDRYLSEIAEQLNFPSLTEGESYLSIVLYLARMTDLGVISPLLFGSSAWGITNKGNDSLDEFHDDLGHAVAVGVEYSEYLHYLKMGLPGPFLLADLERAGVQIARDLLESFDWPVGDSLDANEIAGATQILRPLIEGRLNRGASGSDTNER